MPSYLVELTAGELGEIAAAATALGSASGQPAAESRTARPHSPTRSRSWPTMTTISATAIRCQLDSIAVPGGFGGAMENWGAITYNDQLLLLSETIRGRPAGGVSVQAHEMAHQWNGDL